MHDFGNLYDEHTSHATLEKAARYIEANNIKTLGFCNNRSVDALKVHFERDHENVIDKLRENSRTAFFEHYNIPKSDIFGTFLHKINQIATLSFV